MESKREKDRKKEKMIERERERQKEREIHTIWRGKHQWTIKQGKGWVNAKIG